MRERPSCVVALKRFGVWRAAVTGVAAAAIASMLAWGGLALAHPTGSSLTIGTVAALLATGSAALAASLVRVQPGTLTCDGGAWTFAFRRDGIDRIESGDLAVALDLGSFLLLVLAPVDGTPRRARRWLPVQRRGLEGDWHALRCAVFSPPPAAADAVAAHRPLPE